MCKLCESESIQINVRTNNDAWYFSTSPVVGMMYCPLCGEKYDSKPLPDNNDIDLMPTTQN